MTTVKNVYEAVPEFVSEKYLLRKTGPEDSAGLLKVYSDERALPLFNRDNCYGEDFHYTTPDRMNEAIGYWLWEYSRRGFVRWSVIDRNEALAVGTVELFRRSADDYFDGVGLLRLDLRSDREKREDIVDILNLIVPPAYELFDCNRIATKAIPPAKQRIEALLSLGFSASDKPLIGHDGTEYRDYYQLWK